MDSPIFSQKLKLIHPASIHPVHFGKFSFSSSFGQISRNHAFCRCVFLPWTWPGRTVRFIGIWTLNPLKTSGGQSVALGGFGIWLGGYFLSSVLIIHPWVLSRESRKPAQFKQTCLGSLMVNGSTRWVMYRGFVHLDTETRAAELHWSLLLLVNLAALCLDGVRSSRPLYNVIAWLLRTCNFQAKKCCFFKGRSPLFFYQNPQGIAVHFRLAKSWDVFAGPHNICSYCKEANGLFVDPCRQLCTFPMFFRWSTATDA